jgi:hypothetical protein
MHIYTQFACTRLYTHTHTHTHTHTQCACTRPLTSQNLWQDAERKLAAFLLLLFLTLLYIYIYIYRMQNVTSR